MVRTFERKTHQADIREANIRNAIRDVIKRKSQLEQLLPITAGTLQHRIEKYKRRNSKVLNESGLDSAYDEIVENQYQFKYTSQQVLASKQEDLLEKYLIKCSRVQIIQICINTQSCQLALLTLLTYSVSTSHVKLFMD